MTRRQPRSTQSRSAAASDVYKRQVVIRSGNLEIDESIITGEADPIIPIGAVREVHAQIEARYGDSEKLKMVSYAGVGHEVPPRMLVEAVKWLAQYV